MTRSVAWTLTRVWNADVALADRARDSARLRDLATIETRVRANLSLGVLTPRDLRDAALARLDHAPAVLGAVELDHVVQVGPVWQPLLNALTGNVRLTWRNPGATDIAWFAGGVESDPRPAPTAPRIVSCATPRAEAVEALRWMRELMASGRAHPEEIAICATATEDWDDHMLVLATDAGLPVHFSHGVPALASREGQACGALADVLLEGIEPGSRAPAFGARGWTHTGFGEFPLDLGAGPAAWRRAVELDQWRRALDEAHPRRTDGVDVRPIVTSVLEQLAKGPSAAEDVGRLLLGSAGRALWIEALRRAPPQALEFSLQELRLPDGRDPGACAVWCPAGHLAAAPRRFVRLLGMTTRSWPRRAGEVSGLIPS